MGAREEARWCFKKYWRQIVTILTPVVLLPLPMVVQDEKAVCGYALLLMAVYWCTECLPLPLTALIPVFLLPCLGLLPANVVASQYMKDSTLMFFGGLSVAIAFEKCNLHKRIAVSILKAIGAEPKWLMFGFMLPSWFLSMWISNTATTAMMLPMVEAVLGELEKSETEQTPPEVVTTDNEKIPLDDFGGLKQENHALGNGKISNQQSVVVVPESLAIENNNAVDTTSNQVGVVVVEEPEDIPSETKKYYDNMAIGMSLAVAYAANVGGIATLTGTTPNILMKGHVDQIWREKCLNSPIQFASWMVFGAPLSLILVILIWLWLWLIFIGCGRCGRKGRVSPGGEKATKAREAQVKEVIKREASRVGPWKFSEVVVLILFITMILLFFFRDPEFMTGWARTFKNGYVGDAVPALFIAFVMFVIPSSVPKRCIFTNNNAPDMIMDWKTFQDKMPWGMILLVGGGFAIAEATQTSGLAEWLGEQLTVFSTLPGWAMVLILTFLVTLLTNVTSNSATCTLLMPIMSSMAQGIDKNPLYLMFPVAISTSLAFMLPVATPPNAIVFSYGRVKVVDMCKAGAFINVFSVIVLTMATHTWATAYFKFDQMPWPTGNETMPTCAPLGAFVMGDGYIQE